MAHGNNARIGALLSLSLIFVLFVGCDSSGSSSSPSGGSTPTVSESEVSDVVVSGAQPDPNFQSNGRIDVKATPVSSNGTGIIDTGLDASINVKEHRKAHQADIDASVQATSGTVASGDDPAIPILLDGSGSMGSSDPNKVRIDGAEKFIDILDEKGPFESAVLEFPGSNTSPAFSNTNFYAGFTGEVDSLENALLNVSASGGTPMYPSMAEVLAYSENERPKSNYQKGLVVLADGQPGGGGVTEDSVCTSARQKDAPIYAIGLGPASDITSNTTPAAVETMRALAQCSNGGYRGLAADSIEVIEEAFESAAVSSTEGSVNYEVKIESGLSQIGSGDTLILTLVINSGGSKAERTFRVTTP